MKPNPKPTSLLVIGGHDAGKTHYGGQLLGRLRERESFLKLRGAVANIEPFEEALNKLGQGVSIGHTPTLTYLESIFPIESASGEKLDLMWPDYGGEQITKNIIGQRKISSEWQQRIRESDGWLLFVRLEQIRDYNDVLTRPIAEIVTSAQKSEPKEARWSDQAIYVELLQFFLFAKGVGVLNKLRKPALIILLSCWDEMDYASGKVPSELLRTRMPMLFDFVTSTWESECLSILGLSSLGKRLRDDQPDDEYLNRGPESFGYVVLPDGSSPKDLTLPISMLSKMAS